MLGLGLAVALASSTPTLSLLKDNLKVMNMPLGDWLHILATNFTNFVASQTLLTLTIFGVAIFVLRYLYQLFLKPLNLDRALGDVGYILDGKKKRDVVNDIRRRRKSGDLPPIYPNGWIPLVASQDLVKGDVKYISAVGKFFSFFTFTFTYLYRKYWKNDETAVELQVPGLSSSVLGLSSCTHSL